MTAAEEVEAAIRESDLDHVFVEFPDLDGISRSMQYDAAYFTSQPRFRIGWPGSRTRFVRGDTCPTGDATTPEVHPIMDAPDEAPDGLVVLTGFHIGGIMGSPAAGSC